MEHLAVLELVIFFFSFYIEPQESINLVVVACFWTYQPNSVV